MESFFHTLKVELVHREHFATREEAKRELFAYLEGYYNRQRLHSAARRSGWECATIRMRGGRRRDAGGR